MKNIKYIVFLIVIFFICSASLSPLSERQKQKNSASCKTEVSPAPRAPPADSLNYSVQINGQTNTVILNGKKMENSSDTTDTKNKIRVSGEGNEVLIIHDDQKSEVIITQKGKNNQINISQKQ